ncbi:MAG TPA: bifunctional [glutamine synthetase] adenylyltransferase/[glutamine synthetase]-adenylyl-L-tyrosine phosphorylase, partial [Salinarimonas sp.]|nr:bifunctional [glutamine synthetase] adenylyltransferase/[glutamine synthetase]-adenylyl-L-tyrosine phosphorylase [Salinarimonas sp.]
RARVIAGDESLARDAEDAIRGILRLPREPEAVAREAAAMRALIAQEKGEGHALDMKLAPGALTDLDFIAQTLVLAHAADYPDLVGLPPCGVYEAAAAAGLLDPRDAGTLAAAHTLLSGVMHWQRLAVDGSFDPQAVPPAVLKRIATEAGMPDARRLKAHLDETRERVRAIFLRLVGSP